MTNSGDFFLTSLSSFLPDEQLLVNQSLKPFTSFGSGGIAGVLVKLNNIGELTQLIKTCEQFKKKWLIIGKGSNTIFSDNVLKAVLVTFQGEFKKIELIEPTIVKAGTAVSNEKMAAFAHKNNLSGIEFMSTIPGSIGGAVFMNAGAHGTEIKDILHSVEVLDDQHTALSLYPKQLDFSYRHSIFHCESWSIISASFKLVSDEMEKIKEKEMLLKQGRKKSQPIDKRTWGSVFKNPEGLFAGKLIEECNLKGKGHGKAKISEKHANFIENIHQSATFTDAVMTIKMAKDAVKNKYGIELIEEVRIYNDDGDLINI